jgi:predicted TIM-barrel fold metal-dependent hydrolase
VSAGTRIVDVHAHVCETKAIGAWSKDAYEIWEYGGGDITFSSAAGDLDDLRASMLAGGIDHAVVVNAFSVREWIDRAALGFEPPDGQMRTLGERLVAFNRWLVEAVAGDGSITPFIAIDPWVLPVDDLASHLVDMREAGARGIKIHPVEQRFAASDPRMIPIYRLCVETGLSVLSHAGPSRDGRSLADARTFADVARAVPKLRLIVAHLGGAGWRATPALAADHPGIVFDLSEIVEWTGAPNAPSERELSSLIRAIGVQRVMFGTDFPWYEPGETVKRVRSLPGLSDEELEAILGGNAIRILSLPD